MMDTDLLKLLFGALNRALLLCVGDAILDRFVHGEGERIFWGDLVCGGYAIVVAAVPDRRLALNRCIEQRDPP